MSAEVKLPTTRPALPNPRPLTMLDIEWEVVTMDSTRVLIALTPANYQRLSINMARILRWSRESMWLLYYYRDEEEGDRPHEVDPTEPVW